MNKKLFSVALMGVLLSAGTFVSCTDYDDDIASLQEQINKTNATIESLQSSIAAGSVITSVAAAPNGVIVTLSNGNSFTITNGKDGENGVAGKDGSVVEIGANGNWFIDGVDTGLAAQGVKGEAGVAGADGNDGAYWEPREDGYFWKVEADGTQTKGISWMKSNGVTAVMDANSITFYNVAGSNGPIVVSLDGNLASMVFMPTVYLDGIEATKYTYVYAQEMKSGGLPDGFEWRNPLKTVTLGKRYADDYSNTTTGDKEFEYVKDLSASAIWYFAPANALQYHVNPQNATIEESDLVGFNVLNPEILQTKAASKIKAKPVARGLYVDYLIKENYKNYVNPPADPSSVSYWQWATQNPPLLYNEKLQFGNVDKKGILNVGLWINAWDMVNVPTQEDMPEVNNDGYVIALQVKSEDVENPIVTSDYALVLPVKRTITAIQWYNKPDYKAIGAETTPAPDCRYGDLPEHGDADYPCHGSARIHLWETPQQALQDPNGAALEIDWQAGMDADHPWLNLGSKLGICFTEEIYETNGTGIQYRSGVMPYGQEAPYGLYYEFERVNYSLTVQSTCESDYLKENPNEKGLFGCTDIQTLDKPGNAPMKDGFYSESEVDREPLVRVLVKNADNKVVLEGYVLFHITRELPNTLIEQYPIGGKEFDPCNDVRLMDTYWNQFHDYVLVDGLDNLTKESFDQLYEADCYPGTNNMRIFNDAPAKGADATPKTGYGYVNFHFDEDGPRNHTFDWWITPAEYEALTHHKGYIGKDNAHLDSIYVRFQAKNPSALQYTSYNYVYVKLRTLLWRSDVVNPWANKIDNYWYGFNYNDDAGWDVIRLDVEAPRTDTYMRGSDGTSSVPMVHDIRVTLVNNKPLRNSIKYYFVPDAPVIRVTTQKGNTYDLVTDSERMYCNFIANDSHSYNRATLEHDLLDCAINAGGTGVFSNNKLYAKSGGTKTHIATLDQSTGVITLRDKMSDGSDNVVAKDLLNAISYEKYKSVEATETFAAWIGVIDENDCSVALPVKDDIFLASWERPINLVTTVQESVDANNDENTLFVLDWLKIYDWRGVDATEDNQWFWAYYGIKAITIDFKNIKSTLNNESLAENGSNPETWPLLRNTSTMVEIMGYENGKDYPSKATMNSIVTYDQFDILKYNHPDSETHKFDPFENHNLLDYMSILDNKYKFGAIYYKNNGDNVTKFSLYVPVTVTYFWGDLTEKIRIDVVRTVGN